MILKLLKYIFEIFWESLFKTFQVESIKPTEEFCKHPVIWHEKF